MEDVKKKKNPYCTGITRVFGIARQIIPVYPSGFQSWSTLMLLRNCDTHSYNYQYWSIYKHGRLHFVASFYLSGRGFMRRASCIQKFMLPPRPQQFRNRKPALTAYIGLGPGVIAGHSKILVKKMGPSIIISWKRKDRQREITTHNLSLRTKHLHYYSIKCKLR